MQPLYPNRINWENEPSTNTPLGARNLNKMDSAIYGLDQRVLTLGGYQESASQSAKNAKASEVNAKTSELNASASEEQARQYMERAFSGTPEGYEQLVEDVRLMEIQTTTDTTLANSKAGGYRLVEMHGATEQKTTSGAQLFDKNAESKGGYYDNTGVYVANGGFTYLKVPASNGDSFYQSGITTESNSVWVCGFKNGVFVKALKNYSNGLITVDVDVDEIIVNVRISTDTSFMLNKGTTALPYEPYTGGQASPNPDYPQSINNVGDCVEMESGAINSDGSLVNLNTRVRSANYIPCNVGDSISIAYEKPTSLLACAFYNENGFVAYNRNNSGTLTDTFNVTSPSGATQFKFVVGEDADITPQTAGKITLTINGKYLMQVKTVGKNLLNETIIHSATNTAIQYHRVFAKPNTKYTLTSNIPNTHNGNGAYAFGYNSSGSPSMNINGVWNGQSRTITTLDDGIIILAYRVDDNITNLSPYWFMLNEGSTALPHEKYKETVATILLNEPLREGDVLFKENGVWKVERNSDCLIGSNISSVYLSSTGKFAYFNLPNSAKPYETTEIPAVLCSKAKANTIFKIDGGTSNGIGLHSSSNTVHIRINEFTTADEYKAIILSDDFEVQYPLATPTYEVLDNASQIALNSLETFDTVTYISVDSRVQPSEIVSEYGTSKVGAYTLKALNENDTDKIERAEMKAKLEELAVALVAL